MEKLRHKVSLENVPVHLLQRKIDLYCELFDRSVENVRVSIYHDNLVEDADRHELIFLRNHEMLVHFSSEILFNKKKYILHLRIDNEITKCLSTDNMLKEVKIYEIYHTGGTKKWT